jgi:hypothetical protein
MTHEGNTTDDGEQVQPGGRVSKATYDRFREFVRRRHGSVRGNLGTELEKAMEDRMDAANNGDPIARIENDVATIKAMLAEGDRQVDADGGETVQTRSEPEYTHTRGDGKPAANAPTEKKLAYLADQLTGSSGRLDLIPEDKLRNTVKSEYGFKSDTAKRYVDRLIEHFNLVDHPSAEADVLVSEQRRRELLEQEADEQL